MEPTACNNENGVSLLGNGIQTESTEATKTGGALYKYRNNSSYRRKIQLSGCIGYLAFTLGWVKGQVGPSFPDILQITGTDLERGSAFITSFYVGRIVGSLSGVLYDRCNKHAFLATVCIANGITVALIPWCSMFELMVTVYLFHGAFAAAMDVGSTAASFSVWGRASLVFYQAYQFLVSIGGILSPLVVAPFLGKSAHFPMGTDFDESNGVIVQNTTSLNSSNSVELSNAIYTVMANVTMNRSAVDAKGSELPIEESKLYIAYCIAAVLVSMSGILFIVFCKTPMEPESEEDEIFIQSKENSTKMEIETTSERDSSNMARNFAIFNICVFSGLYTAVELGMGNFLTVFCLRHMKWSKLNSVFAVSIFYLLFMVGRLFGIVIVKFFKSLKLLCFSMIMSIISFSVLLVCAYYFSDIGVWICTGAAGLSISILFPTAISWTNKAIAPVLGTVSTLIFVTSYVGPFINPPLLSFLMNSYDYMWFCYILLLECVLMLFTYLVMVWLGKKSSPHLDIVHKVECDK
ncbi:sodium-dependent glucose transporter 1A-like [Mizuhopecten yessoensis]|uniref:Sodium-dependent glucose transporter 1A n=1 Tax=Mizuhopecten yessoensis TaxID=6573 RepID=A0A210PH02_MIZYE|nr:sodium-dependent glucose transporter 1A-like [Mizuhopecten yessoensis]OWF35760.1 Sodium-dependent glucose transporter 1A [Mizuhopecten yessoensis]